jgi:hypothetical protein
MLERKKQNGKNISGNSWTDKAADKIADLTLKFQTRFSNALNKQLSKMSRRNIKLALISFCVISGGFSIYLVANAIFEQELKQPVLEVKRIRTPRHFDKTGHEINEQDKYVSEELFREIQAYKRYMDSIRQTMRPGLQDSIQMLEQIYHSQKIK